MRLDPDWRRILRRAWSVRIMVLAAVLTGCEAVATVVGVDWVPLPPVARALLLFALVAAALISRIVAQRGFKDGD